jgi:hypothetical protein
MSMIAAQATGKDLEKFVKPWQDVLKAMEVQGNDLTSFLTKHAGGI